MAADPGTANANAITRKDLLAGAAAVGGGLALAGAPKAFASSRRVNAASRGTLNFDLELESRSFNALDVNYQHLRWVIDQVQETLYTYDDKNNVVPLLADGPLKQVDKLNYDVKVKQGVRFHNGDELTADHVAATFNEARAGAGRIWVTHLVPVAGVKAVDKYTARFTLNQPWTLLLDKLIVIPIMHSAYLPEKAKAMGTGPFMWGEYQQGQGITLVANPRYRGGPPKLAEVHYRFVPDQGARLINILRGDSQILGSVPYTNITQLKRNSNIKVYEVTAPINLLFWVSAKTIPDVRIRQALGYAMDRQKIKDVVFGGHAEIGEGPIGPATEGWSFTSKVYPPTPNVDKARALLKAANASNFTFNYVSTGEQVMRDMGATLQQSWAAAGINAKLEFLELGPWVAKWATGAWGICTIFSFDGIAFGRSADPVTRTQESGSVRNYGKFNNRIVNKLLGEARVMPPGRTRAHLFGQVSDVIAERAAMIPPAYPHFVVATRKEVQGLPTAPLGVNQILLKNVSVTGG